MAPWSVVKDDSQDTTHRMRGVRYAVLSLAALVVVSLGFALVPPENPAPPQPAFTDVARAAALQDALDLRAAAMELASAGGADSTVLDPVVTLLTIQARALVAPGPSAPDGAGQAEAATASASYPAASATPASTPSASSASSASSGSSSVTSVSGLAAVLTASGSQRIKDAQEADGGMARLLAGTGTAQLLAAARLGAPVVDHAGAGPDGQTPAPVETGPSCPAVPAAEGAGPGAALAAALTAEQQAVYGYQAALPRLAPAEAGTAQAYLAQHGRLTDGAEARLRLLCAPAVPRQPGYAVDAQFLAAPAAGLGRLEAATLAAYADLVALSQGPVRAWALTALQSAAGRAGHWGADPGPVPGMQLDVDQLPALPAAAAPSAARTAS